MPTNKRAYKSNPLQNIQIIVQPKKSMLVRLMISGTYFDLFPEKLTTNRTLQLLSYQVDWANELT